MNSIKTMRLNLLRYLHGIPNYKNFPKNIILQTSVPRTGSSWLFDALCVHPNIDIIYQAYIHKKLLLSANRYPVGLANQDLNNENQKTILMYALKNEEVRVPNFTPNELRKEAIENFQKFSYAIESIHPDFYKCDDAFFEKRLSLLEQKGVRIKLIYQVREPRNAIFSFLKYKERDPEWVTHVEIDDIPNYYLNQYKSILRLMNVREGIVVDYNSLNSDFTNTLHNIFTCLWEELSLDERSFLGNVEAVAINSTSRKQRVNNLQSKFISQNPLDLTNEIGCYTEYFSKHDKIIQKSDLIYQQIIKTQN